MVPHGLVYCRSGCWVPLGALTCHLIHCAQVPTGTSYEGARAARRQGYSRQSKKLLKGAREATAGQKETRWRSCHGPEAERGQVPILKG